MDEALDGIIIGREVGMGGDQVGDLVKLLGVEFELGAAMGGQVL